MYMTYKHLSTDNTTCYASNQPLDWRTCHWELVYSFSYARETKYTCQLILNSYIPQLELYFWWISMTRQQSNYNYYILSKTDKGTPHKHDTCFEWYLLHIYTRTAYI